MGEGADAVEAVMKDLLIATGLVALSLGLVGAVVFGLGDETTFVSPPHSVAEEFVRAVGHGRLGPARSMLASELEQATSIADLRRLSTSLRERVGRLDKVKGSVADRRQDTVMVTARVEGNRQSAELVVPLVRESGAWAVAKVADLLRPANPSASGEVRPR